MQHGVFLDLESLDKGDLDLQAFKNTLPHWAFYSATQAEQTQERIKNAQVIVTNKVVIDDAAMAAAPDLRLICVAATGMNNIDLPAAERRGISVKNVSGYGTTSVVQHVFTLIFALSTRLMDYTSAVRRGDWARSDQFCLLDYPIQEVQGMTLGLIGHGTLGQGVIQAAQAFGMNVLIAERRGETARPGRCDFEQVIRESDIISLHCPLTEQTQGMIGEAELQAMPEHALLINTARGGLVDEAALAKALKEGWIAGAGIDVISQEPPGEDMAILATDIPNLIVTPHCAWGSRAARQRLLDTLTQHIRDFSK